MRPGHSPFTVAVVFAVIAILAAALLVFARPGERGAAGGLTLTRDGATSERGSAALLDDTEGRSLVRSTEVLRDAAVDAGAVDSDADGGRPSVGGLAGLAGLVVDGLDRPLAGVAIDVREDEGAGFADWTFADPSPGMLVGSAVTDDTGVFEVSGDNGRLLAVSASLAGFVDAREGGCSPGSWVRIVMTAGAGLEGFVTTKGDGTPIAGAVVRIQHGEEGLWLEVPTDVRGYFSAEDLSPGDGGVIVVPPDHSPTRWRDVVLTAGVTMREDFSAEGGWTLGGRVTDARTGDPIVGAEVSTWEFIAKTVRTDGQGFFRAPGNRPRAGTLVARAPGYGRSELRYTGEREDLDLALERGLRVVGRLVGAGGAPVAGARVTAAGLGFEGRMARREWSVVKSAADGTFAFDSLRADLKLGLQLRAVGRAVLFVPVDVSASRAGVVDLGDLTMAEQSVLAGRVLSYAGEPAAGIYITLSGPDGAPVPVELERDFKGRRIRTDQRGRFFIPELSAGTWQLMGETFTLTEGEERVGIELRLPGGATVRGRVQDAAGQSVVGAFISLQADAGEAPFYQHTETDEAGAFEIEGVPDVRFSVRVFPAESEDEAPLQRQTRRGLSNDGEFLEFTLQRLDAWLEGRVEDAGGAALAGVYIAVDRDEGGLPQGGVLTDATGGFRLRVRDGVDVILVGWHTTEIDDTQSIHVTEMRVGRTILGREEAGMRFEVGAQTPRPVVVRFSEG